MDHLSFVFSLLLIVMVTTISFGSVIKAKNSNKEEIEALLSDAGLDPYPEMVPNHQELEALLKRSHDVEAKLQGEESLRDQDRETSEPKIFSGAIIEGDELKVNVMKEVLKGIDDVNRKVAIGIVNKSGMKLEAPSIYFFSGTANGILPRIVDDGKAVLYGPRKTKSAAKGAVGVLTYYVSDIEKTLAVMWSVPFDYNLYENWWNVKLYDGYTKADKGMYEDLYYSANPFRADGWHERDLGTYLKFRGSMTNNGQSILEISVLRK